MVRYFPKNAAERIRYVKSILVVYAEGVKSLKECAEEKGWSVKTLYTWIHKYEKAKDLLKIYSLARDENRKEILREEAFLLLMQKIRGIEKKIIKKYGAINKQTGKIEASKAEITETIEYLSDSVLKGILERISPETFPETGQRIDITTAGQPIQMPIIHIHPPKDDDEE